jgi:integrase
MAGSSVIALDTKSPLRRRVQKGSLRRKYGSWHVEYMGWARNTAGVLEWRKLSSVLGSCKEFPRRGDIEQDYRDFMAEINAANLQSKPGDPRLAYFVEHIYFKDSSIKGLATSTVDGYQDMWRLHLDAALGNETLHGLRPVTIVRLLDRLAQEKDLSRRSLAHIKAFLSGVYTYARNHGYFDGANPVTSVKLPKASKPPEETYAYSNREEKAMMDAVKSNRARLAIAIASWTGVDKGELEGLRWEDRVGHDLYIRRKIWSGEEKEPKTEKRKAPIPIISHLAKMLDVTWKQAGSPNAGWIFPAARGSKPLRMDNLAMREIIPNLRAKQLAWHGWHSFRRGLATNLRELGVPDDVIQRVLRHADIGTTQQHYAKTLPPTVRKAMAKYDSSLSLKADKRRIRKTSASKPLKIKGPVAQMDRAAVS